MTEPGCMCFMQEGPEYRLDAGGCGAGLRRCCCAGESFFRVKYENTRSNEPLSIGLTPLFPAKVVPVNLDRLDGLTIKRRSFLASFDMKCDIRLKIVRSLGVGCFGGQVRSHRGGGATTPADDAAGPADAAAAAAAPTPFPPAHRASSSTGSRATGWRSSTPRAR